MDAERFAAYAYSLMEELPEPLKSIEKKALEEHVPIIRRTTQSLLRFLLAVKKPGEILEVGTAVGFSALFMKEYMPEGSHITTIEKVQMRLIPARENLSKYDKEGRITLLEGDAVRVLEELAGGVSGKYDFIFMDAAKGQYLNFLPYVRALLRADGLLVSDNILQDGELLESRFAVTRRDRTIHSRMRDYLYCLTHSEDLETVILPVGDGVALTTVRERK